MKNGFLETIQNLTILIAEDNLMQREKLKEILSLFTENIVTASDGFEAIELYKNIKPNIVISDIKMPKIDGLELIKMIRDIDTKVPIIILTAHTEKDLLLKAVSLHLVSYLVKPINKDDLINSLEESLDIIKEKSLLEVKLQDNYIYSVVEKCIYKDDEKIKLTKKELAFLNLLINHKNQIVSKETIEDIVWPNGMMTTPALKNFIFKLRKKIGINSLVTSSSLGYSLQISSD